jgi:hypothetical protein
MVISRFLEFNLIISYLPRTILLEQIQSCKTINVFIGLAGITREIPAADQGA